MLSKKVSESGDGYVYKKCEICGKITRYPVKDPKPLDIYKWLGHFKCSRGFKTKSNLTKKQKKEFWKKDSEKSGKDGAEKRWIK